jgi:hypothetical protein
MRRAVSIGALVAAGLGAAAIPAGPARAQTTEDLIRRIEALQRRVEELEAAQRAAAPAPRQAPRTPAAAAAAPRAPAPVAPRVAAPPATAPLATAPVAAAPAPAPTPEQQRAIARAQVDEALRGELGTGSFRIPGTDTSVRVYGFIKANLFGDIGMVNRSDAPSVQGIPLAGSVNDQQSGDIQFQARRSRIGFDTSTPTPLGPLFTKIEMDFAGSMPSASDEATASGYEPRLRLAYARIGGDGFNLLFGQNASLWNNGVVETLTDSTFLSASSVRQGQLRIAGRLAEGLTGMLAIEAPFSDFTTATTVYYPSTNLNGGAGSWATNQLPDLLARLTYGGDTGSVGARGLLRQIRMDTSGTSAPVQGSATTTGYGIALDGTLNMRSIWDGFGPDQLIGSVHYGEGIGRYLDATLSGQGALSNIGLPGVNDASLTPLPSWGVIGGYKRYWTPALRSNFSYAFAQADVPGFASQFAPGGSSALSLNSTMQMGVANLIWSPFATERNGRVDNGRFDVGVEYIYYRRNVDGGAVATGTGLGGYGIEQRIQVTGIARF